MNRDYLAHYGVKGMRWGHRKDRRSSDSGSKKTTRAQRKQYKEMDRYYDERRDYHKTYSKTPSNASTKTWLSQASKAASKDVMRKYGKTKAKEWQDYNNNQSLREQKELKAIMAACGVALVGSGGYIGVGMAKNAVKNRK